MPPDALLATAASADAATTRRGGPARKLCKAHRRLQTYALMAGVELIAIAASFEVAAAAFAGPAAGIDAVLLVLAPLHTAIAFQLGAYGVQALRSWSWGVRMALTALLLTVLIIFGVASVWRLDSQVSRGFFATSLLLSAAAIVIGRHFVQRVARGLLPDGPIEIVVISDDPLAVLGLGYEVIDSRLLRDACNLDSPDSLDRLGRAVWRADRVLLACAAQDRARWVTALKGSGIDVEVMLPEFEALGVLSIDRHQGRLTGCVAKGQLALRQRMVKRAFDIAIVVWLLPLLLLTLLLVTIAIKLDDGGPVFFVQRRIGQANRFFDLFKFRTMRVVSLDQVGDRSTAREDPRITRVGGFLRRTSTDELPQLLNVLLGSMSIVGPRPHAPGSTAENELFWAVDQRYWLRHAAKPGVTGLAQVRGFRGATDTRIAITDRIQADLEYIVGWSIWRDMRILAATVGVLVHPNAY